MMAGTMQLVLFAAAIHCCGAFSSSRGVLLGRRPQPQTRQQHWRLAGVSRGSAIEFQMCGARESKDVCDLQSKKDELLQEKLSLLRDYGVALTISREQLEWEIQSLEAKKSKMEADALASAEKVVEADIYEEDDWEDGDLPTGWDSLPWSEGYQKAVKRAERREARAAAAESQDGSSSGTSRRVVVGEIYAAVTGLVLASSVIVGLTAPDNGREQLDYITLIADLEKGTQIFARMGEDLYSGKLEAVAKACEQGGDIEEFLTFCMVRWSLRAQRSGTTPTETSVHAFRGAINNLGASSKRGDAFASKRSYATARSALNAFIRVVNMSIPPGTAPPMPEVLERKFRPETELCKPDSPC